jgi:hypothetical protein
MVHDTSPHSWAFADMSRMAWYAVEAFYPEWNNWQSFVNEALQKALE